MNTQELLIQGALANIGEKDYRGDFVERISNRDLTTLNKRLAEL